MAGWLGSRSRYLCLPVERCANLFEDPANRDDFEARPYMDVMKTFARLTSRFHPRPWLLASALFIPLALHAQDSGSSGSAERRVAVANSSWFRFYSDFRFNLYDAVLTAATARRSSKPDPFHSECFDKLVIEEQRAWDAAVIYFSETVAATADFSRERFVVRTRLAGNTPELDDDDRRDLALSLLFLDAAERAYRACAWPEQDEANRRWARELEGRLARHGEPIRKRLEELFGIGWRSLPIDVDLVGTAGWAGADTIAMAVVPTHIQVSSRNPDYQGSRALEIIFHEAAHELVTPHNGPIARLLAAEAEKARVSVDRNLWHGLLFVTVGEVTRQILEAAGEGPYQPFADKVFNGPSWAPLLKPLQTHWLPFVSGQADRDEAARTLLIAIETAKKIK